MGIRLHPRPSPFPGFPIGLQALTCWKFACLNPRKNYKCTIKIMYANKKKSNSAGPSDSAVQIHRLRVAQKGREAKHETDHQMLFLRAVGGGNTLRALLARCSSSEGVARHADAARV